MKKLFVLFAFLSIFSGFGQSGWVQGHYYQQQGQVWTESRNGVVGYDWYNRPIYGRICRQTVWHSEYRSGYQYIWNGYQWVSQWCEGWQWYYTWSGWYAC